MDFPITELMDRNVSLEWLSENIYLQVISLSLGTVFIGTFDEVLRLKPDEQHLGLILLGRKQVL
jgi:hypothetical protein